MEKTFVMIKPDGVSRGLVGEIVSRFEKRGYKIEQMKSMFIDKSLCAKHYSHLTSKPFYPEIEEYITGGMVICMVLSGERVIEGVRQLLGVTDCFEAQVGTIRATYATNKTKNLCHASDSPESASEEIKRFFG